MMDNKKILLDWIEGDRERLIEFLSRFIQAKSPNPPGDTVAAADHVRGLLDGEGLEYRVIAPNERMPNIVASFEGGAPGRHLVLNGHIDVFPVPDEERWSHGPWSGAVAEGRIWGRGAADMKCGTTASIFTYLYLSRIRDQLKGRLTLTAVSDEETFGPYGARYLIANHREVHGDCCLNGEPSGPRTLRFGEKGLIWLRFTIATRGAHGAYPHLTVSASKLAARLIGELESLTEIEMEMPDNVVTALKDAREEIEAAQGAGAADVVSRVSVNVGLLTSGVKVNMTPGQAEMEVDVRLPVGVTAERVLGEVETILERYPEVSMEEINRNAPSWCDPFGEMAEILRDNVRTLRGFVPKPVVSLGATDTRLWRYENVPAYVYGPVPAGMGSYDEHVEVEEFLHTVRTHVLSAYDYLSRG
ncbi:MAG: M20/M25/M40 family metallo-hydrolase [Alphaproteobacteria bacterium]